jgi:hypothetical protein
MKKIISILLSGLILTGITSCDKAKDKIDELTEFDIAYTNDAVIPASSFTSTQTVTAPIDIKTPDIPTNSSANFSSNKTSGDLVSEIKMTKLALSVTSGNLDFVKSVTVSINASGLTETVIGSKAVVPTGQTNVELDMTGVNIKDFIKKDNFSFRIAGTVQTGGALAKTLKMSEVVRVKATLIK